MHQSVLRLAIALSAAPPAPDWPQGFAPRRFEETDAAELHALFSQAYAEGSQSTGRFETWWPSLRDDEEYDSALVLLACDPRGRIAGAIQCWTSGFVKDLAVRPDARRLGLGRALMLSAFDALQRRGHLRIELKTHRDNTAALALYRSLGMQEPT